MRGKEEEYTLVSVWGGGVYVDECGGGVYVGECVGGGVYVGVYVGECVGGGIYVGECGGQGPVHERGRGIRW